MKQIESVMIKYMGYKEPSTEEEVQLEILGLQTAIAAAQQRIAVLTQSVQLQGMVARAANTKKVQSAVEQGKSPFEETNDEKTVPEATDTEKAE